MKMMRAWIPSLSLASLKQPLQAAFLLPPAYYGTAVLLILASMFRPMLMSEAYFWVILRQAAPLGLVVLGQALVVRVRSIDLSVGGIVIGVNYIATSAYLSGFPDSVIIIACLALGILAGVVNGTLITRFRGSAVIVTMAMTIIFIGVVVAFSRYTPPGDVPELVRTIGSGRLHGIPIAALIWACAAIPLGLIMRQTVFGRYLDAAGANPTAAALSGIPYLKTMLITHIISGFCAALGGLLLAGFVGTGSTDTGIGQDLILNSIAAVILGGVTFGGGRGRVLGPVAGAFMLTFLLNFLTSFGFEASGKLMMQGGIIAMAAMVDALKNK
jgi:ribose transport system permease protein